MSDFSGVLTETNKVLDEFNEKVCRERIDILRSTVTKFKVCLPDPMCDAMLDIVGKELQETIRQCARYTDKK